MNEKESNGWNIIVGAGLTGLTAARILACHGQKCVVLEKEIQTGGLCRSFTQDGVPFDVGPHVMFNEPDLPDCAELDFYPLKNIQLLRRRYLFALHVGGKYWNYPVNVPELLKYPLQYKLDILKQTVSRISGFDGNNGSSIESMIIRKSGKRYYNDLFASLMEKKTGMEGNQIHHDWYVRTGRDFQGRFCPPDFVRTGFFQGVCRSITGRFPYFYPKNGFGSISDTLLKSYHQAGGKLMLNSHITSIESSDDRIRSVRVNDMDVFPVQNLIWTGSIKSLLTKLDCVIPNIVSMNLYMVYITFKKSRSWKPSPWIYVYHPGRNIIFTRSYYPSNIYHDAYGDCDGIALEIHGTPTIQEMDINSILDTAVEHAVTGGLVLRNQITQTHIEQYTDSIPVYPLNYRDSIRNIYSQLNRFDNLYAVGKPGSLYYCLARGAMKQGIQTAAHILNEPVAEEMAVETS